MDVTHRKMSNVLVMSSFVNKLAEKKNVSILVWRILVLVEMLAKQNRSASLSQNMAYFVTNLANGDFILKDLPL